jgi:hypothetical protein
VTKAEAYRFLHRQNSATSFLANVVLNQYRHPAKRLKALVALVKHGADVRLASHSLDQLLVDGYGVPWTDLDTKKAERICEELAERFVLESVG